MLRFNADDGGGDPESGGENEPVARAGGDVSEALPADRRDDGCADDARRGHAHVRVRELHGDVDARDVQ